MKTVSYKEYQKEVNKKKKSSNTSKIKKEENIVKENKTIKSSTEKKDSSIQKKKESNSTKVKINQNSNKEKKVTNSVNSASKKTNSSNTQKKKDTNATKVKKDESKKSNTPKVSENTKFNSTYIQEFNAINAKKIKEHIDTTKEKEIDSSIKNKEVKIIENITEENDTKQSFDTAKKIYNENIQREINIYKEKNINIKPKQIIDEQVNNISKNSDIKILDEKELNKIIKSYEKDIKKEIPKKRKKKRRIRWNNVTLLMFILFFLTILIISSTKIINWLKDSKSSEKVIIEIQEETEIIETETTEETEIIEIPEEEEKEIPKTSPYWTYIEMNLIDVDFTELKEKNSDVSGWIQVNGTNINYPYVQTSDNEYYLTHSFDKTTNSAGWVFMDYRNNKSDFDKNTIIYAHSRKNNTMFGTLRKILKNGWLNNTNNHVIKLSTESENTLWQVFSVYRIPTTNDYIQVSFINDKEFTTFGEMLIGRSAYNFNTTISSEDKILTLSTCYDDYDKVVLHAKLIKREKK